MDASVLARSLPAHLPRTVWIELTSTCPFDCVFCSRRAERGTGEHLDFTLYRSLIRQLRGPAVIRLNYSGESLHYPRLEDAIRLAAATGATTEIVTALASASPSVLRGLTTSRLDRLSISIHSLDDGQFRQIYGIASASTLRERIAILHAAGKPALDFAFVAMSENLAQLEPIAEYARSLGVPAISIHPVIRRGPAPRTFGEELRPEFDHAVRVETARVAARVPEVAFHIARPRHDPARTAAGVTTCEQNPWDTLHALADGTVVPCEVQDKRALGNLKRETLDDIWRGPAYRAFRQDYLAGRDPVCAACVWRRTVPAPAEGGVPIRGWHAGGGDPLWSQPDAAAVIAPASSGVVVRGILPPPPHGQTGNALEISAAGVPSVRVVNPGPGLLEFTAALALPTGAAKVVRFSTTHAFCPAETGWGPDQRRLGFALLALSSPRRITAVRAFLDRLRRVPVRPGALRWLLPAPPGRIPRGVSAIVPARDTPDLLPETLDAARAALARIAEPAELIVIVSGADARDYQDLRRDFPARWIFFPKPLDYLAAIRAGLRRARHGWVYLLNSDMRLDPPAIERLLPLRRPDTFALATRIRMADGSASETNWTGLRIPADDAAELIELDPSGLDGPRRSLYAGGGSALFQKRLLGPLARHSQPYTPFYFEDVEWGSLAWRFGYSCVFSPDSIATHGHRQTVRRYHHPREVDRVFERNRLLFHLRNLDEPERLERRLLELDDKTWSELFAPRSILATLWGRAVANMAPLPSDVLYTATTSLPAIA